MRLDKYLKVSRIIKRRTLAKEVADAGRISINNRIAKAGTEVAIDDIIEINYGNKQFVVKVTKLVDSTKKDDAKTMFEIIKETSLKQELE